MARRIKKPAVKPEMRRQWLHRHEEEGESIPQIAKADGYDVRTVRKQIEIERQERERREARSIVLRNALEQHYADLCAFAQKLDSCVASESSSMVLLREDRMWAALREHLPRSVLWKNLDKREHLQNEITRVEHELENSIEAQVKARSTQKFVASYNEVGFSKKTVDAISTNAYLVARDKQALLESSDFEFKPDGENLTDVQLGPFYIGRFPNKQAPEIKKLVTDLLNEVTTWEEYDALRRLVVEFERVERVLHDELAITTLRRVVPGRCRYCPI